MLGKWKNPRTILNIYVYLVLFFVLFSSETIYEHVYSFFGDFFRLGLLVLCLPSIFFIDKKSFLAITEWSLVLLTVMLLWCIGGATISNVFTIFLKFFPLMFAVCFFRQKRVNLFKHLERILVLLISVCVIFYLVFDLGLLGVTPTRYIWQLDNGYQYVFTNYLGIYFRWHRSRAVFGYEIISANGFWHEPGAYQIYTNLGLFIALFLEKKVSFPKVVLFVFATISSTSTVGLLLMVLLIIAAFFKKTTKYKTLFLFAAVIVFVVFGISLMTEKMQTQNWDARTENFFACLNFFAQSPLVGYDVGTYPIYSGLLSYFVIFGLLGVVPIAIVCKARRLPFFQSNPATIFAFYSWYFLCMLDENYAYYTLMFLIYGVCIFYTKKVFYKAGASYEKMDKACV